MEPPYPAFLEGRAGLVVVYPQFLCGAALAKIQRGPSEASERLLPSVGGQGPGTLQ